MENSNDNIIMSRIAFERMQAKDERNDRWRNITIVLLIVLLVVTNAMWLVAWNQYDYVDDYYSVDMQADDSGSANYIGNNGDINNGGTDNSNEAQTEQDTQ